MFIYQVLFSGILFGASSFPAIAAVHDEGLTENNAKSLRVQVTGTVLDEKGEPLIGATVYQRSSANGVVTDVNGQFSISVPSECQLVVNYIGYKQSYVQVKGDTGSYEIKLENDAQTLTDVVVVGYGSQKKINLSGAVDQITAKDLDKRPISDVSKGLQGMIPNLNIDFTSGEPGQAASINIRGTGSINGGAPLLLIDGVAADIDELNNILPADIESISILKDAASAAIYGARAAFGVILVTTKKGSGDRIKVSYNNHFTWKRPSQLTRKTSDPYIYLKLKNVAVLNTPWSSGHVTDDEHLEWARQRSDDPLHTESVRLSPLDNTQWEYMGNTDWTRHYLDKYTFSQAHEVSLSGATERTSFYLSAGYNHEDGVLKDLAPCDGYDRYNTRMKVNYKLWEWLTIGNNTSFEVTKRDKSSYYNLSDLYDAEPWNIPVNPNGTWASDELGIALAQIADGGSYNSERDKLQSTFTGEASFWKGVLRLNANFTISKTWEKTDWFKTKYELGYGPDDTRTAGDSWAEKDHTDITYTTFDLYGTFSKDWGVHNVNAVLGFNQEYNKWNATTARRNDLVSASLPTTALATGDQYVSDSYRDWAIRGLYFRLNYIFDNRYIVEVNGRYDGTSRFPKKKRFGFFPSTSWAWRVDQEKFFRPLSRVVSELKLRASYGSLGNQLVSEYGYIPAMSSGPGTYIIDGKLQQTVWSPGLVSDNYTWEKIRTFNLGVDLGFFDHRLTTSFDIYQRDTRGMLTLGKDLPGVLGASEPQENAANMRTTGWELSVNYRDKLMLWGKPLTWSARLVLSDNKSKITKFDNRDRRLSQYYEGQVLGEIWGLQNDGLFQSKEEIAKLDETQIIPWGALPIVEGWPKYKDLDHDGKITKGSTVDHPGDLSVIGNASPRYRYGINLSAEWNGFDVSLFMQGIGKRDYYPISYLFWSFYQQPYTGGQLHAFDFYRAQDDSPEEMAKHSQSYIAAGLASQNLNAKYPVFQAWLADKNLGTGLNAMGLAIPQTQYMLNGAYFRMKNITIGYTLPSAWTQRIGVGRLRVYVSGDNLFEFSELKKYFDPEAVTASDAYGYVYPFNRQFTFGLNLTF